MPNPHNLTSYKPGVSGNLAGKPIGTKNRSTIARKILSMKALLPDEIFNKLQHAFPDIEQKMTAEEIATIVILGAAITKQDYNAYKAIMDSAYGLPKQEVETTGSVTISKKITFK
jgi:hypothetical protein